jgi:hypothetical protein
MRLDLTGSDSFEPLKILGKIYVPEPDKSKCIVDAPALRRLPRAPPTPAAARPPAGSEKGVRSAQNIQVGPCVPVEIQL